MDIQAVALAAVSGAVCGYGFRGWMGRKLVATGKELEHIVSVIESAVAKDASAMKNDLAILLSGLKARL